MKKFWHIIGVWFLIQFIFISMASNYNSIRVSNMTEAQLKSDCLRGVSPVFAAVGGVLLPLTLTDIVDADFCWNM